MAATSVTYSYDALLTTTLQKFRKKLVDNIFVGLPLFDWLRKSGRMKTVSGGTEIIEHLLYGQNTTARAFSGYDVIDLTPQDGITIARFTPREYTASVVISRRQKQMNAGPEQMINLLEAKSKQAMNSLRDLLNSDMFAVQSGDKLDGLGTLVATTATTAGGINASTETWWDNQRDTASYTAETPAFLDALLNQFNDSTSGGGGHPDLIITTQTIWEGYHAQVQDQGRFTLAKDNPAAGFGIKALGFMGEPLVWDLDCPANRVYGLNSDTLSLAVYKGADFDITELKQPIDQHAFAKSIYFMGNLTVNDRRKNFVMSAVT